MTVHATELRFLQGLIEAPSDKRVSDIARRCSDEFGIGKRVGQRFVYSDQDVAKAVALLQAHRLPVRATDIADRAGAVGRPGLSEKHGTPPPHQDSVAFRIFRSGVPEGTGYAVATSSEVAGVPADLMMVVENFETLRQLHRYAWVMERMRGWNTCLVLFRGDNQYPVLDAHRCIHESPLPKVGFHDFDPAGLQMSLAIPGLVEHLIPPMAVLEAAVRAGKRSDLYFSQIEQYANVLNSATTANIPELWSAMKRMQKGYPQEWMRDFQTEKEPYVELRVR